MEADQFEKGSMLPKIEAGISFIEKEPTDAPLLQIWLMHRMAIKKNRYNY